MCSDDGFHAEGDGFVLLGIYHCKVLGGSGLASTLESDCGESRRGMEDGYS